jgi:threonine/homoserine/homoserine lactone efflux protein
MIVDPLTLAAFLPAALALNLSPGADMMFCLGLGLRSGPRAAWAASAGISAGSMVHVTAAGLGLAALIAHAPHLFDAARWIGVGYLLWLAIQALRGGLASPEKSRAVSAARAFGQGLAVNLSNPKLILFVLAFIPQFVDPARPVLPQFLAFGGVIALGGGLINGAVGHFAGQARHLLLRREGPARLLAWITASIFGALAVRLAFWERA